MEAIGWILFIIGCILIIATIGGEISFLIPSSTMIIALLFVLLGKLHYANKEILKTLKDIQKETHKFRIGDREEEPVKEANKPQ